jgi:hypothetical protein
VALTLRVARQAAAGLARTAPAVAAWAAASAVMMPAWRTRLSLNRMFPSLARVAVQAEQGVQVALVVSPVGAA